MRTQETAELVALAASQQTPHHDIARILGIGDHILLREYGEELQTARIRARLKMGGRLFNMGMAGNVKAAIYWLQTQGGPEWRPPPQALQHSGPQGGAIPLAAVTAEATDQDAMTTYLAMINPPTKE